MSTVIPIAVLGIFLQASAQYASLAFVVPGTLATSTISVFGRSGWSSDRVLLLNNIIYRERMSTYIQGGQQRRPRGDTDGGVYSPAIMYESAHAAGGKVGTHAYIAAGWPRMRCVSLLKEGLYTYCSSHVLRSIFIFPPKKCGACDTLANSRIPMMLCTFQNWDDSTK